ncbi:MAG: alpha-1,2-fucosyltransferase, partial [Eubacteriales bacterium]
QIFKITSRLPVFYSGPRKYQVRMWRKRMNRKYFRKWNGNVVFGKVFIEEAYSAKMQERLQDSSQYTYIDKFFPPLQFFTGLESLIKDIQFVEFTDQRNIVLANEMKCQNSVSIHIRRGDYVGTNFDRVTIEYYKKAVEHIQNIIDDPKYYIFSDDIDYVTDNFKWLDNQVIVTNNRVENSYCDMQLMSMCKHNIITNSTFSTWGALLNKNANKVVCYPFLDEVIDRSWIGIRE